MKFELINEKNKVVMNTSSFECVPCKEQIEDMLNFGYKIKVDNKVLSKKKIEEFLNIKGVS